jgi:hypothetical protein
VNIDLQLTHRSTNHVHDQPPTTATAIPPPPTSILPIPIPFPLLHPTRPHAYSLLSHRGRKDRDRESTATTVALYGTRTDPATLGDLSLSCAGCWLGIYFPQIESPTGTGKSLTLLTATISWLRADQTRREDVQVEALENKMREEYENGSLSSLSSLSFFVVVLGFSLGVRY